MSDDVVGRTDDGTTHIAEMDDELVELNRFAADEGAAGRTFAVAAFSEEQAFVCADESYGPVPILLGAGLVMTDQVAALDTAVCSPVSNELVVETPAGINFLLLFQFTGQTDQDQLDDPIRSTTDAFASGSYCYVPDGVVSSAFADFNLITIDLVTDQLRECISTAAAASIELRGGGAPIPRRPPTPPQHPAQSQRVPGAGIEPARHQW